MTKYPRMLGLSAMAVALLTLGGCKTDVSGNQDDLLTCSNNQIPDAAGAMCVDKPLKCEGGLILDDAGTLCVEAPFSGPDPEYFPAADEAVIYLNRQHIDQAYSDWVLHLWNSGCTGGWTTTTSWPDGPAINGSGVDPIYGAYWVLDIQNASSCGNWIIHNRAASDQTSDFTLSLSGTGKFARMAFVIADYDITDSRVSQGLPICINDVCEAAEPPARTVRNASAHWLDAQTLVWDLPGGTGEQLFAASMGGMGQDEAGAITHSDMSATLVPAVLTAEQIARVPHLASWQAFQVEGLSAAQIKDAAKGELWVTGLDADGNLVGTAVQTARLLDALYTTGEDDADEAELGVVFEGGNVSVSVWAPTAQRVRLKVFNDASPKRLLQIVDMAREDATGIWSFTDTTERLNNRFYRFETQVYDAQEDKVVTLESTDPYSVSLAERGFYSQIVDLNDAATQPDGWGSVSAPALVEPEQAVIYEGHVRDFSIRDESTSAANRGKYLAFTETGSAPVQHLAALQAAGLTHFHVLPTADFASINEVTSARVELTDTVAKLCALDADAPVCGVEADSATLMEVLASYDPATDAAKSLIEAVRGYDGFNWGYDPYHYNTPDGSYASDPDGIARIKELRAMNQALHAMGLRVVMDVVYNHTSSSGLVSSSSTFDKIVPGYYFRRDPITGAIENASGAGSDTAGENRMMGKFITESVVHWAKNYGYDDFRFDLMTFVPKAVIEAARAGVREITPDTYFYGEGWNMGGSTANDAIFERSEQYNMAGSGVGTFNDRMRDPMRYLALVKGENADRIRAGLAGNLASFELYNNASEFVTADTLGAYTDDPQESINYVSKHDNETLWDMIQKEGAVPVDTSAADRARIQNLTLALPMLSQGVPFFHMGSDLLRSKSMDRNTYDAGDWYNYVDFTKSTNNWAIGMPLDRGDASEDWIRTQFAATNTRPEMSDIDLASAVFAEFMTISQGSPLFSLPEAGDVKARVGFHNTGSQQVKGVIAMSIDDGVGVTDLDPAFDAVMVLFNGNASTKSVRVRTATGFSLHATQASSVDTAVRAASFSEEVVVEQVEGVDTDITYGTFSVPAYSAAVFVKVQGGAQGAGMDAKATVAAGGAIDNPYTATPYLRGDMNGWSTNDPFLYNGDGTFTVFSTLTGGNTYNFKFASSDWSTVNYGATSGAEVVVSVGVEKDMAATNDNFSFTPVASGEYRFTVKATNPTSPTLTVSLADPYANAVFLKGSLNGWADVDEIAYVDKGLFSISMNIAAGTYQFKLADAGWSAPNIGVKTAGDAIEVGGSLELADGSSDNINVTIADTGDYIFTLDTRDAVNPTLHLVKADRLPAVMYVKGSMNGWGSVDAMTYLGGNKYRLDLAMTAGGYEFKVANDGWTVEYTADGSVRFYEPKAFIAAGGKGNSAITVAADAVVRYELDANFAEPKMIITVAP